MPSTNSSFMAAMGAGGSSTALSNNNFPGIFTNINTNDNNNSSNNNNNSNDDNQLEPGQRDPTSYGKNGSDFLDGFASFMANTAMIDGQTMIKCKHCQQQFHNNHLLKMHKFYAHNIPFIRQDDDDGDEK
ncbi:hypothetical protein BLA29_004784 [Euroglyphus maynei]|uniref:C2H2-type domain-containing protein n=1 Tax=Euroglyphus maynei TaxID=6958 RepID=A0A1Y3BIA1_EURMA|nr:hypothetical protein BLA29_004784 [Euroglyphus maynei]